MARKNKSKASTTVEERNLLFHEDEEYNPREAKIKLSMWVDGDIFEAIKKDTLEKTGSKKGYQTYLNKRLREIFIDGSGAVAQAQDRASQSIQTSIDRLNDRITLLEAKLHEAAIKPSTEESWKQGGWSKQTWTNDAIMILDYGKAWITSSKIEKTGKKGRKQKVK